MIRWPTKTLGELCEVRIGRTPRRNEPRFWGGNAVWVTVGELNGGEITSSKENISEAAVRECMPEPIPAGTLLFSFKLSIGKMAVAGCPLYTNEAIAALPIRDPEELSPDFLRYALMAVSHEGHADRAVLGKVLNKEKVKRIAIPMPPLAEQGRIVKLLNEAGELRELRAKADSRTAVLHSALFHELFGRHIKSPPVLASLEGTIAPKGWRWCRLTDVARLATGHTPSRSIPGYWNGNIPWISLTDIRSLDGTAAYETSQSVTEEGIENSSAVKLPEGTVCFSRTASVGFVTVMGREMCTSQDFVNWVCGEELDSIYLMGALMQSRDYLRSLASGSTHKTIYFPTVEQFCVVVPPLARQKQFAERANEIRELQADQAASSRRLDDLFQSMLHRVFNGDL
jgi:type I restriction enzyme S subunit